MTRGLRVLPLTLVALAGIGTAKAALYAPGDIVTNLTFTARRSFPRPDGRMVNAGEQVGIKDFPGHIIFLEWFAVWCPFCQAAVPQVDAGIVDHYAARGGRNSNGVPVLYLFVNQESASFYQTQTDHYIDAQVASAAIKLNDYGVPGSSAVRTAFQSSGQPIFAVINGVTNSPTHPPWQVLVNHRGYGDTDFNQELAAFRSLMDSVRPAPAAPLAITGVRRVGSEFQFSFPAQPDQTYRVQGSANLTNWTTLATITNASGPVVFLDPNAPPTLQLYRVTTGD